MGSVRTLREWLDEGPFSLSLSSSWLGLFCHAGVVCALAESGLFPSKISGSSAGALVAVLWAATMDADRLREVMQRAEARNPMVWASLFSRNFLPGVVNIHKSTRELLERILEGQAVPDLDENSIPVLVSAFDITRGKTRVFSEGSAADALAASMAVPLLFKPVWAAGRPLLDGAVSDVAGVDGLERSERVLYHHATYLPLWMTQHLRGFPDLVALKIDGLPHLNPWRLPGNGMDAFRRAKEATLRALDAPMVRLRRPIGAAAPAPTAGKISNSSSNISNNGSSSSRGSSRGGSSSNSNSSSSSSSSSSRSSSSNNSSSVGRSSSRSNNSTSRLPVAEYGGMLFVKVQAHGRRVLDNDGSVRSKL